MKRFKHSLSNYKLLTCDMGELVPCGMFHVLPGDSVQQATSLLVRLSPVMAPVMHPVRVQVHHWYVPYRILWNGWEDFITGVSETPPPTTNAGVVKGGLLDYLGVPPNAGGLGLNTFAINAYNKIWNEFYRDQDLEVEVSAGNLAVLRCAWEKDYFTTARPWPQKGGDVTIPLGVQAPIKGLGIPVGTTPSGGPTNVWESDGAQANYGGTAIPNPATGNEFVVNQAGGVPQVFADLTNATAANINDVRRAFALQRYQEARAQYGSRYTEYLRYLGVRPSDARLQRPEYLGGGKATVSFTEVLKTGAQDDPAEPIGTMKGHGISAMRSRRYRRFFEEHGVVLSLLSVRPRTMYTDGIHREWRKQTKEDYWQKELELIGQQSVDGSELHPGGAGTVWGYQDRYAEYRHIPSTIAGDFRDTLNYWHLARSFSAPPVLNQDFIRCDPGKRIFAEQTEDSLWIMAGHSIQARRMVTKSTIGRII